MSSRIEFPVIDQGVDYSELALAVAIVMPLLIGLGLAGRSHGMLLLGGVGVLLCLFSILQFFVIFSILKRSRPVDVVVSEVWLGSFRKPGYAGVVPRYRVQFRAELPGSTSPSAVVSLTFFRRDNVTERIDEARALAEMAAESTTAWEVFPRKFVLSKAVGSAIWVEAAASMLAGLGLVYLVRKLALW